MSRTCQLTGKKAQSGHNVSHSKRRTNRKFQPNLQKVALASETLGRSVSLRISTRALRTVGKKGGLDAFLLQTADARLPDDAMKLKRQIKRQISKPPSAKAN